MCRSNNHRSAAVLGAVLTAGLLAGCHETTTRAYYGDVVADHFDRREAIGRGAGDALATNKVVQMYDPWPAAAVNKEIPVNGAVIAAAVERYRTGRVIQPKGTGTSSAGYGAQTAPLGGVAPAPSGTGAAATP